VVTVLNGDAIPVLQRRIFDAGFERLDIIPLGADKVLVRSLDDEDVSVMFSEAPDFFGHFFSTPVKWNKDILVRERGAWVRIYGVPLHAWNINFFKLCIFDCGRLLKVDDSTLEKERFDYARVLLSTTALEVINTNATIMVDDALFDFKIIEEWGYSIGEDACLFDEEEVREGDIPDTAEVHEDVIERADVDEFVNQLSADWDEAIRGQSGMQGPKVAHVEFPEPVAGVSVHSILKPHKTIGVESLVELEVAQAAASPTGFFVQNVNLPSRDMSRPVNIVKEVLEPVTCQLVNKAFVSLDNDKGEVGVEDLTSRHAHSGTRNINKAIVSLDNDKGEVGVEDLISRHAHSGTRKIGKRTTSCPPGRVHSFSSGPWSLKWINRQNTTDKIVKNKTTSVVVPRGAKKKVCGALRHNAQSVKHIARLPAKDRLEILRALRKTVKKRGGLSDVTKNNVNSSDGISNSTGSQSSVNNDWTNWLVLHGNKQDAVEDVCGIGKAVGLKFQGDKNNSFDVLSGAGRKNKEGDGGGK
jgi:hypothetical protein